MKCKNCGREMDLIFVIDSPQRRDGRDFAYNLYACEGGKDGEACGYLCKENVWTGAGILWIKPIQEKGSDNV